VIRGGPGSGNGRFGADQGQRMPDMIRAVGERIFDKGRSERRPAWHRAIAVAGGAMVDATFFGAASLAEPARAPASGPRVLAMSYVEAIRNVDARELAGLALFFGVVLFAVVTAVMLVRTRERLRLADKSGRAAAACFEAEIDRLYGLLLAEPRVIVVWDRAADPEIIGDPAIIAPELSADGLTSYAAWLRPDEAVALGSAVARLIDRGESFSISVMTASGRYVTAEGRAIGGCAVLKLAEVSGSRKEFVELSRRYHRLQVDTEAQRSEAQALRADIARTVEAHRRTLDQLSTGVAIFGADHNLAFYNSAYRALWDIDAAFLDQAPTDSAVLDRLRAARRLPEQTDFRAWKAELHQAYRASAPARYEWHLPDQRTLRVVTTPSPDGGVTYLFDDVTERLNLERRYDALIRVQGETLDNLAEAVALFGSDGRVRLFNPVFVKMWRLSPAMLAERPHIETVIERCRVFHSDEETWRALRAAVTALDSRNPTFRRIERADGSVVECRTVPMPDGATLVTFQDVTDSVNVERALTERNAALIEADKIKIDFVKHVSYELRSPLTNIIGFAQFLGDSTTGPAPLTARQAEYLGYITASSNALLAIIDNILDLASIGAGAMTLDLAPVDISAVMLEAAEGVQDRLVKSSIRLELRAPAGIGSFVADERRIRQILFNLLANAVGFSPAGETVTFTAARTPGAVTFMVTDRGPGIPGEIKDKVFGWFETHSHGTRHRGAGLGLSIVRSFVELHRGTVQIDSVPGHGTTVICTFPLAADTV
jgi:signal transduction histidine kinase